MLPYTLPSFNLAQQMVPKIYTPLIIPHTALYLLDGRRLHINNVLNYKINILYPQ